MERGERQEWSWPEQGVVGLEVQLIIAAELVGE